MSHVQIEGSYTEHQEIELIGTPEAWHNLAQLVASEGQVSVELVVPQSEFTQPPSVIKTVNVVRAEDPVEVDMHGQTLVVRGGSIGLSNLAWLFQWLADNPEPSGGIQQHVHIEHAIGPWYSPSALPIVATVIEHG